LQKLLVQGGYDVLQLGTATPEAKERVLPFSPFVTLADGMCLIGERGSETVLLINARTEGGKTMSVQQIEAVAQAFADAFNHGESPAVDVAAVAELLDEDLEVFDTSRSTVIALASAARQGDSRLLRQGAPTSAN
jgi:hypothetical protein